MPRIRLLPLLGLLGACSNVPTLPGVTPYRIEIQQGNYVSQEMVSQLKLGMTREQVRFVLGTPLVTDIFHADRWDYVYYREPPGKPREQRRLTVFFVEGKLARVAGDVIPAGSGVPPAPAEAAPAKPAVAPAKPEPAPPPAAEAPPKQNWSAASDDPDYGKDAKPPAEPPRPQAETPASERGFFGRMIDRMKGD
ncbi:MAG: outer membrane protein assembly factor BamE [Betaproteobacteria bacterium]|nr:outer membrane protein assembly factor BamE [Betaproteobacteria bacterium]